MDTSVSFDESRLVQDFGLVRFEASAQTRYAFDLGTESWYQRSVKLDEYYKPFAKGYIAPWKLIPTGGQDVIRARYEGKKAIDLSRVRFASAPNSPAIPAEFDESTKTWKLSLPATDAQSSYNVFAIYEGKSSVSSEWLAIRSKAIGRAYQARPKEASFRILFQAEACTGG